MIICVNLWIHTFIRLVHTVESRGELFLLFVPEPQAGDTRRPVYRDGRHLPGFKVHDPAPSREFIVPGYKIVDAVNTVDFIFFHYV